MVVPEAELVWVSGGALLALTLATALAGTIAMLFAIREPTGIADRLAGGLRKPDRRVPSAA
ncbi:MAG: hypothetical protein SF182_19720 [Deltaproteobacteria bacterium]|nr:hypothetical protein [Deltaproteobacteria bacterium]